MVATTYRVVDMAAIVRDDIEINQGEDWSYKWVVRDPETSDPIDLTGWTGKGEIRSRPGSTVLYTWGPSNMSLNASGECTISVPSVDSSAWLWVGSEARYDIKLTNPSGKNIRLAEGLVIVSLEVTQ
jgi:hypothetical protein